MRRIKKEHPEDDGAIENDRVKGYLKVTRAFGAGFLKQVNIIMVYSKHPLPFISFCNINQHL